MLGVGRVVASILSLLDARSARHCHKDDSNNFEHEWDELNEFDE
jgi:hypothetical protein